MALLDKFTTSVLAKGRVVLSRVICRVLFWLSGARVATESEGDNALLKPLFAVTRSEDVFGCMACDGSSMSLDDMEAGILEEARHRHVRG